MVNQQYAGRTVIAGTADSKSDFSRRMNARG